MTLTGNFVRASTLYNIIIHLYDPFPSDFGVVHYLNSGSIQCMGGSAFDNLNTFQQVCIETEVPLEFRKKILGGGRYMMAED